MFPSRHLLKIDFISINIRQVIAALKKSYDGEPDETLPPFVKYDILPILEYGILVYNNCRHNDFIKFEGVQIRFINAVFRVFRQKGMSPKMSTS